MLTDLSITNIAIINSLQLTFRDGLTVFTGETGAGKSIIIDAVGLIMGGRASAELIRSGEDEARVEALFDIAKLPELKQRVIDSGFQCDNELLVKRSISRGGKNRIFINGGMATLAQLSEISRCLINIYGQHESQTLLRPENQLLLLDAFAGSSILRGEFENLFRQLHSVRQRLEHLDEEEREAVRKLDLLSFQSEEIAAAALKSGEEEELEEQRRLLANAGKLGQVSTEAFERLYGSDGAMLGQLNRISHSIKEITAIDHTLADVSAALEAAYLQLEDASISLRDYASRIETDPATLQQADDRLDQIGRLKRKYGVSVEDILDFKQRVDLELQELQGRQMDRQQLETQLHTLENELHTLGQELTSRRTTAAIALQSALEAEVHQLAMKNAVIQAALIPLPEPRSTGFERVEFLFSPNPGEPPRPLAKIASGGELSRLMLSIKQVLPEGDVGTLVFDEVDTGIGGATSELVGRKLKKVSTAQQVLCITHLPQVAVFADNHLCVAKQLENGRTATSVTILEQNKSTEEIARMLGGATITATTLRHAEEMLAAAKKQQCS